MACSFITYISMTAYVVGTHWNCLSEALLMCMHLRKRNICTFSHIEAHRENDIDVCQTSQMDR